MYPIFIGRRMLLCKVFHMKTTYMSIKPRLIMEDFKGILSAQVDNVKG